MEENRMKEDKKLFGDCVNSPEPVLNLVSVYD
jgi:hypothetical protein